MVEKIGCNGSKFFEMHKKKILESGNEIQKFGKSETNSENWKLGNPEIRKQIWKIGNLEIRKRTPENWKFGDRTDFENCSENLI